MEKPRVCASACVRVRAPTHVHTDNTHTDNTRTRAQPLTRTRVGVCAEGLCWKVFEFAFQRNPLQHDPPAQPSPAPP
eukprot:2104647-Pyramimonas_sp.AAC.1